MNIVKFSNNKYAVRQGNNPATYKYLDAKNKGYFYKIHEVRYAEVDSYKKAKQRLDAYNSEDYYGVIVDK